jgi:hypothetical protein
VLPKPGDLVSFKDGFAGEEGPDEISSWTENSSSSIISSSIISALRVGF